MLLHELKMFNFKSVKKNQRRFTLMTHDSIVHLKTLFLCVSSLSGGVESELSAQHWKNASVEVWIQLKGLPSHLTLVRIFWTRAYPPPQLWFVPKSLKKKKHILTSILTTLRSESKPESFISCLNTLVKVGSNFVLSFCKSGKLQLFLPLLSNTFTVPASSAL